MDEILVEEEIEVGKPLGIKEVEKKVMKQLNKGNSWVRTKEVAKTAGKVGLMALAAAIVVAGLGVATAYAEKHMK